MREKILVLKQLYLKKLIGEKYCQSVQFRAKQGGIFKNDNIDEVIKNCALCELSKKSKEKIVGINTKSKLSFITLTPLEKNGASAEMINKIAQNVFGVKKYSLFSLIKCNFYGKIEKSHISACKEYLNMQLDSNNSDLNIVFGEETARYLIDTNENLENLRKRVIKSEFSKKQKNFIVTFAISDLLRKPALKKDAFEDFKYAKSFL